MKTLSREIRCARIGFWMCLIWVSTILVTCSGCVHDRQRSRRAEDYPDLMRAKVVELARALRGRPYRSGGVEVDGMDCSGFVRYVFHAFGYSLPREARLYSRLKPAVRFNSLQAADVLVFRLKQSWHVGVYTGENRFVHAPSSGQRVREEAISPYWSQQLVRAVRVIKNR